ncbi:SRPBCC family protein [Deminuibacter soli]|uniref:Uncharacterized protein n=1 Tax=Deminuibacter soli TaxID=2291815 RepID=A0A3E1NP89_9BACT|nr:hypothetical protein [Deminuibacter soli]RFM29742.1 hypothetical protein DXN05_01825 [Deminuibacter soli]
MPGFQPYNNPSTKQFPWHKNNGVIAYTINDGRKVKVLFSKESSGTKVTETFKAEDMHSVECSRVGGRR